MHLKHLQLHQRNPLEGLVNYVRETVNGKEEVKRDGPEGHHHGDGSNANGNGDGGNGGDGSAGTAVSIVYVTASKTFNGPVMGYTTVGIAGSGQQHSATAHASAPTSADSESGSESSSDSQPTLDSSRGTATGHSSAATGASSSLLDTVAATTDSGVSQTATDSFAAATSTPAAVSSSSSNAGLSGGAKAGIAIGVILAVALLAGLGFFAFRPRKLADEANEKAAQNEKANPFGDSAAAPAPPMASSAPAPFIAPASAPREVPSAAFFDGPAMSGALGAAAGAGAAGAAAGARTAPQEHLEKPVNPFAETANNVSQASLTQSIPIGADEHMIRPSTSETEKAAFGATVAGAALAARPNAPPSLDNAPSKPLPPFAAGAAPASPAASTFSVNSATAGAVGAAAGGREPPVHRVQLDFRGSMHDELDVKIGDLVAIIHEYDDGWVLARRLDKSKQGVCPRSCLSQRALQPRNRGPPPPGARGPPPPRTASPAPSNRGPGRSESPAPGGPPPMRTASPAPGSRSASPALNPNMNNWPAKPINASTITPNMNQWPMKPTNAPSSDNMTKRSMSPGPYGGGPFSQRPMGPVKRRSNSMGNIAPSRPLVPGFPGADRMNNMSDRPASNDLGLPIQSPGSPLQRKPVPGQAS